MTLSDLLEGLQEWAATLDAGTASETADDIAVLSQYANDPATHRALWIALTRVEGLRKRHAPAKRRVTITPAEAAAALRAHGTLRAAAGALGVSAQKVMRQARLFHGTEVPCSPEASKGIVSPLRK